LERALRATTGWWVLLPVAILGAVLVMLGPPASLDHPSKSSTTFAPGILGFEFLGTTAQVLPDPPEPPTQADCLAQVEVTPACRLILAGEPIVDVTLDPPRVAWVDDYPDSEVRAALLWDLLFIVVYVALLALLARTGRNYRTVSTRRLAPKLMWLAVAAGVLDLLENVFIWLAVTDAGIGRGEWAWRVAAAAAWGKWLLVVMVALYGLGGRAVAVAGSQGAGCPPDGRGVPRKGRSGWGCRELDRRRARGPAQPGHRDLRRRHPRRLDIAGRAPVLGTRPPAGMGRR
jgi:hypothetical protein